MRLFSYVVRYDFGFAPNPYFGVCSLATCKADVRKHAEVGDWIVGTGSAETHISGRLVYAMKVDETLTFDEYWADERFARKKPTMCASLKKAFGDNIYHRGVDGGWQQAESRHSADDGSINLAHVETDTKSERVLLARDFTYFGGDGPEVPARLRSGYDLDVVARRGYRNQFTEAQIDETVAWLQTLPKGVIGRPIGWARLSSANRRAA